MMMDGHKMEKRMKRKGVLILAVCIAGMTVSGCASKIAHQVIEHYQKEDDDRSQKETDKNGENRNSGTEDTQAEGGKEAEDSAGENSAQENSSGEDVQNSSQSRDYSTYIKEQLEPVMGTAKNSTFSYRYEQVNYNGSDSWFASPMTASLENGIVSTYRRDLNKDGLDELLVIYMEGSRQSNDRKNHLCLNVYGEVGGEITGLGKISFDDCFSGYNDESYLIGLKNVGNALLLYAGGSKNVWTWADGVSPEIRLYQLQGNSLNQIYQVETSGSDDSWWEEWGRGLRSLGFSLPKSNWTESDLSGEPGFEVLAYGECTTIVSNNETYGEEFQQYLLDHGTVSGGLYGADSEKVMQMNQSMAPYTGETGYPGTAAPGQNYNQNTAPAQNYGQNTVPAQNYNQNTGADYILPNSSTTYLTSADLAGLTQEQLRLARNEIYARHGRKFQTKEIQEYFNSKSWYTGTIEIKDFKDSYLNVYEKANIKLIQRLEQ